MISGILFNGVVARLEEKLLRRISIHKDHYDRFDLHDFVAAEITIGPLVSNSGRGYQFSQLDVDRIRNQHFDMLIQFGSGILQGDILQAQKLGIISLQPGDNRTNRSLPAAFWETFYGSQQTGFTIQVLTEEPNGGDVLTRGCF